MALLVAILVLLDPGGQLGKFELGVFDLRQRFFAQKTQYTDQICIVVIDEQSIKDFEPFYGRPPWPRSVHAELLEYLSDTCGASAIVFDVMFTERTLRQEVDLEMMQTMRNAAESATDKTGRGRLVQYLDHIDPQRSDRLLAEATERSRRTFHTSAFSIDAANEARVAAIVESIGRYGLDLGIGAPFPEYFDATVPLTDLAKKAAGVGHINYFPDPDGPCRRALPFARFRGQHYPSMAVAVSAFVLGVPLERVTLDGAAIVIGERRAPIDENGLLPIRYHGGEHITNPSTGEALYQSFYRYYPYSLVLDSAYPADEFRNKIVLIGATAAGMMDLRATPFDPNPVYSRA